MNAIFDSQSTAWDIRIMRATEQIEGIIRAFDRDISPAAVNRLDAIRNVLMSIAADIRLTTDRPARVGGAAQIEPEISMRRHMLRLASNAAGLDEAMVQTKPAADPVIAIADIDYYLQRSILLSRDDGR